MITNIQLGLRSQLLAMLRLTQRAVDYSIKAYELGKPEFCQHVSANGPQVRTLQRSIANRSRALLAAAASQPASTVGRIGSGRKILAPFPPDLFVIESLDNRVTETGHGDIDIGNVPPDVTHRHGAHPRRANRTPHSLLHIEQRLANPIPPGAYSFKSQLRATAGSSDSRTPLEFHAC